MTIDDKIEDEKLQYNINREVAKIPVLSSRKIDKYEYLIGEYYHLINNRTVEQQNKLGLHILHQEKLLKNK